MADVTHCGPAAILAASDETGLIEQEIVPCDADQRCDDGDACTADVCQPGAAGQDVIGCTQPRVAVDLANVSCLFAAPLGEGVCASGTALDRVRARVQAAHDLLLRAAERRSLRQARLVRRARRAVATLARRLARKRPPSDASATCRDALIDGLRELRRGIRDLG